MNIVKMEFSRFVDPDQIKYWENELDWNKIDEDSMVKYLSNWIKEEFLIRRFNDSLKYYSPSGKVLDIGAGTLWATALFSKMQNIKEVCSVEVSKNRLENEGIPFFKFLGGDEEKTKLFIGDGHKLAFEENYFDVIFCDGVLHHFDNLKYALKELNRVLKPGGFLVVLREPVLPYYRHIKKIIPKDDFNLQIMNIEYWRYTKQYIYELELNGFEIIKSIGYSSMKKIKQIRIPHFLKFEPYSYLLNLLYFSEYLFVSRKYRNDILGVPTELPFKV